MGAPSDIIVVGAGIVGCAIAHELASRGASVEIVDDRPVGMGATQASAGVLAPYIEAREGSPLLELTARSLDLFDAFVERVRADSGAAVIDGVDATLPVRPVRGQLLHLGWSGTPLRRVTWSSRCYLVPWEDGTLLVGATVEEAGFDERTTVAGVSGLLAAVNALVPGACRASFLSARSGLRPATPDDLPVIGASAVMPNLIYATGHF